MDEIAVLIPGHDAVVVVARGHPLRQRERAQLGVLARIVDRAWTLFEEGLTPPRSR